MYRGQDYERIGAFTQRLQSEYVSAHILMRNTPPDDSIIAADGQCEFVFIYMWISYHLFEDFFLSFWFVVFVLESAKKSYFWSYVLIIHLQKRLIKLNSCMFCFVHLDIFNLLKLIPKINGYIIFTGFEPLLIFFNLKKGG